MKKIPKNPLILVDGSSYLFRAYYALPPLTNSNGMPTGAIYGVLNMLKNIVKEYKPSNMAVIFDTKEPNFRHKLFKDYKANRAQMPDDLAVQIEPLKQLIEALGIKLIAIPGVEADDVIGTLASKAAKQDSFVLISTGDKDMAQLVDDNVYLINTMNNSILDKDGVLEKFGVPPEKIIDYLTLVGDSVDNIPGVEKVGPKTAVKWINEYNNLDNLIENSDKIKGKVGENLRNSIDDLELYKKLTTIDLNISLDVDVKDLKINNSNDNKLKEMFLELGFKTWLKELSNKDSGNVESFDDESDDAVSYQTIFTISALKELISELNSCKEFAFDTETTSLDPISANLVGISISLEPKKAFYIPVGHDYENVSSQLELKEVIKQLKPVFTNNKIKKIAHNIKYDMQVLSKYDLNINGELHDTMLQSYVVNSTAGKHNLDAVALRELGKTLVSYEDVAGKGAKQICFSAVDIDIATKYAAEDADITFRLYQKFNKKISADEKLSFIYRDMEMLLVPVIKSMEELGVKIDAKLLNEQSEDIQKKLIKLEDNATTIAGESFNMNSPKQLQEILFSKLKLPIIKKTPKGQASTAEDVLQELSNDYELPQIILDYRSLSKLKSTYTDKLPEKINKETGRVHTSYHQAVTATGRLSSTDPNLQNIPIKSEEGRKIRAAFIADKGFKVLSADYSQIELRIMAHLSKDKNLIETFRNGEDVHRATAAEVFEVSINKVSVEQRRNAKAINFGLIYGMSAFGLSNQLQITSKEAQIYIDSYFAKFPGVLDYMETTKEFAKQHGYVETMFGRRLYLPEINTKNAIRRKAAERAAINAPLQGAQSDIIKLAMIDIHGWIKSEKLAIKMIMQVHDELVFEVDSKLIDLANQEIPKIMSNVIDLEVDLLVGVGVGNNWEDAH